MPKIVNKKNGVVSIVTNDELLAILGNPLLRNVFEVHTAIEPEPVSKKKAARKLQKVSNQY